MRQLFDHPTLSYIHAFGTQVGTDTVKQGLEQNCNVNIRDEKASLLDFEPHEMMGSLLGMEVGKDETPEDIAERIVHEWMDDMDQLKELGLWSSELQQLEDKADAIPDDAPHSERKFRLARLSPGSGSRIATVSSSDRRGELDYWRAMAILRRSSGLMRWSSSSAASARSICTQLTCPL